MSGITQIASKLLGGGRRAGGSRPAGGAGGASRPAGGAGGSSKDAAIGRGVRGIVSKLRR